MTPRISLRPAGTAAVLIAFAAVVLTLLSVTSLTLRHGVDLGHPVAAATSQADSTGDSRPAVKSRPGSTALSLSHRSSAPAGERRVVAAALGQRAEIHYPGGSPDLPAVLPLSAGQLPRDLSDLPVDASAQVIATTVSIAHRGRAPPGTGNGVQHPF